MLPASDGLLEKRAAEICGRLGGVKVRLAYSSTVPLGWKLYNYQCNGPIVVQVPSRRYVATPHALPAQQVMTFDAAKSKCAELGFKPATEGFGKCVLQLSK